MPAEITISNHRKNELNQSIQKVFLNKKYIYTETVCIGKILKKHKYFFYKSDYTIIN